MISQVSGPLEYDKLQTISPGPIIAPQRRFLTPIGLAKMVTAQSHEPFLAPPHILLLQDRAMKLIAKPGRSVLIIMLPVRHGKSHFLCQYLPAWYMMNYPSRHCLLTTYADDFSRSWGEKAREIFREWGPKLFPGIKLSGSHHAAHDWRVDGKNTGGTMRSIGVGGQISGYGAHLLIGDDLVRNQDEADSVAMRDFTWKWFISDCYTRLEPDGKLIMVLSRRNMADLVGALLEVLQKAGTDHEVLRLAAICDSPDDPLAEVGEPLWPARYPLEVLQEIRRTYEAKGESYLFEVLFNQNPIGDPASRSFPPEYFTNIWVDAIPDNNVVLRILSLDPSSGKGDILRLLMRLILVIMLFIFGLGWRFVIRRRLRICLLSLCVLRWGGRLMVLLLRRMVLVRLSLVLWPSVWYPGLCMVSVIRGVVVSLSREL